ncbi:MAG: DUF1902 domain-containing protein [Clostridiales bacterium]|jgi:hypothetical protein|nr:DUF1902 domain-containing protein [Clostridiales bacterium]MDR2711540.1 DUF1902 domain-containing protein [Clostridiales bacterium]
MAEYTINLLWDPEAAVWVATSDAIPGLVLESGSIDALIERIRFAVPELLELNGAKRQPLSLHIRSERYEQVYV